ncbi:hypothetical protein CXG81DRAFT_26727, partial [Caulochytrium protostelioides]
TLRTAAACVATWAVRTLVARGVREREADADAHDRHRRLAGAWRRWRTLRGVAVTQRLAARVADDTRARRLRRQAWQTWRSRPPAGAPTGGAAAWRAAADARYARPRAHARAAALRPVFDAWRTYAAAQLVEQSRRRAFTAWLHAIAAPLSPAGAEASGAAVGALPPPPPRPAAAARSATRAAPASRPAGRRPAPRRPAFLDVDAIAARRPPAVVRAPAPAVSPEVGAAGAVAVADADAAAAEIDRQEQALWAVFNRLVAQHPAGAGAATSGSAPSLRSD